MQQVSDWFCGGCQRKFSGLVNMCLVCQSYNPNTSGNNHNGQNVSQCVNSGVDEWEWKWEEGEPDVYVSVV